MKFAPVTAILAPVTAILRKREAATLYSFLRSARSLFIRKEFPFRLHPFTHLSPCAIEAIQLPSRIGQSVPHLTFSLAPGRKRKRSNSEVLAQAEPAHLALQFKWFLVAKYAYLLGNGMQPIVVLLLLGHWTYSQAANSVVERFAEDSVVSITATQLVAWHKKGMAERALHRKPGSGRKGNH